MPFAPREIEEKRFVVGLRGYQTDEVESFLRAVASDYRAALERADAAEQALLAKETEAPSGESTAAGLVAEIERVMLAARVSAEQEAVQIRRAAESEAAEIRTAVQAEAEACYDEIARQAEQLHRVEMRLRDQLQALERAITEGKQAMIELPPVYTANIRAAG